MEDTEWLGDVAKRAASCKRDLCRQHHGEHATHGPHAPPRHRGRSSRSKHRTAYDSFVVPPSATGCGDHAARPLAAGAEKGEVIIKKISCASNLREGMPPARRHLSLIREHHQRFFTSTSTLYSSETRKGNGEEKTSRIPSTAAVQVATREFIRSKCQNRERVAARQVLDLMVRKKWLAVKVDQEGKFDEKALSSAYRCVRRYLSRLGYHRGKRSNNIALKESIRVKHCAYLIILSDNQRRPADERLREMYLDESYIHQYYHRFGDSLWDPNDDQNVHFGKVAGGGRGYCFLAAIQGENCRSSSEECSPDLGGLVPNSYWRFYPTRMKEQKGDYHKVFNGVNFVKWWREQLLPNLSAPSLIITDNASYHLVLPPITPVPTTMKKSSCIEYLLLHNIPHSSSMTAVELKSLVRVHIRHNVRLETVELAKAQGHRVLFTPPYHSDLQPIELLWARVKGNVGRNEEFNKIETDHGQYRDDGRTRMQAMIDAMNAIAKKMMHDEQLEEGTEHSEDGSQDSASSEEGCSDDDEELV